MNDNTTIYNCVESGCLAAGWCDSDSLQCRCRPLWMGTDCSYFIYDEIFPYFIVHLIFFGVCFVGISIWAIVQIRQMVTAKDRKSINKPTLILFILIAVFGIERAIYLGLVQYGRVTAVPEGTLNVKSFKIILIFNVVVSQILFGLGFSILAVVQLYVCSLWIQTYLKTKPRLIHLLKRIREAIDYIAIFYVLFELTYAVIGGLPDKIPQETQYGFQIAYFIVSSVIIGFATIIILIFGSKLRRQLELFKDIDAKRKKLIEKMNSFGITVSIIMVIVLIVEIGLIIVESEADLVDKLDFAISENLILRCVEVTYCVIILVTYQKKRPKPLKSTSSDATKKSQKDASAKITTTTIEGVEKTNSNMEITSDICHVNADTNC